MKTHKKYENADKIKKLRKNLKMVKTYENIEKI